MNEVLPGLFVGGIYALEGTKIIENKIEAVITVGEFFIEFHKPHLKNLDKLRINIRDNEEADVLPHISSVNSFIHKKRLENKNVFVHCFGGVSRSVTFIIVYLMSITDLDFETALNYVKVKRKGANPNDGFLLQLKKFETDLLESERQRIKMELSHRIEFNTLFETDMCFIGHRDTNFLRKNTSRESSSEFPSIV